MTAGQLRILVVEDDPDDFDLLRRELTSGGLDCLLLRVDTAEDFERALISHDPVLILSDYSLPRFSGLAALEICRARRPDLPFIFVSGTIGEETAVGALTKGAVDYLLKGRTKRLCTAIARALRDAEDRASRERLEAKLAQAGRMEALGRLAGGVAHDFNNLLTAILGYADSALEHLPSEHPAADDVREMRAAGERASTLTAQLLSFSRMQVVEPRALDLNDVLRNAEKLLGRVLGSNITLESHPAENLACVKADPGRLEQALVNLVANARDALPNGGKVVVSTREVSVSDEEAKIAPDLAAGRYVLLSVADTGCGMDAATVERMFEPFYTTKRTGTGLGLATVHGVVAQFGGVIRVKSAVNAGTTFEVFLPAVEGPPEALQTPALAAKLSTGDETILVVEDEEAVRRLACRALRQRGYEVVEAADGEEALLALDRRPDVRALITDVVMPRLGGVELAERVRAARPDLPVLFLSGFPGDLVGGNEPRRRTSGYLQKPFTPSTLAAKVREVLDAANKPGAA